MTEKLHINCVSCGNCQHPRDADNLSLFCMECPPNEAPCLKVCPKKAIEILGGAITLNKSKCDKCGERAMENAIVSTEMEGFVVTREQRELMVRVLKKEITLEEAIAMLNKKYK